MRPLTPAEVRLLTALVRFHFLTVAQSRRRFYGAGSTSHVQAAWTRLSRAGLVQRFTRPRLDPAGKAPYVYTLGQRAIPILAALGYALPDRIRPLDQLSFLFLEHHLAVNDVLIGAELLARAEPRIVVNRLIHDRDLQKRPVVLDAAGERLRVVPDGWVDFHVGAAERVCMALELDRATERREDWRRKVRGLVAWLQGPYAETFGTEIVTVAVLTTGGATRLADLVRWTEAELTESGHAEAGELFLFSDMPPATDPPTLFLEPCWTEAFTGTRVPLIRL